jgi:hypothetical protein
MGSSPCLLQATGKLLYNPSVYMNGYVSFCIESDASHAVGSIAEHVARLCRSTAALSKNLRLYNYNKDSIGCFDYDDSVFDLHRLSRDDPVVFIFQVEGFKFAQLSPVLKLWQIKKASCTCVIDKPLFKPELEPEASLESKYDKMLRMGIPIAAVHQKMRMDGVPLPPPPPPPPPPSSLPPPPPFMMQARPIIFEKSTNILFGSKIEAAPSLAMALSDIKLGNFALKKAPQAQAGIVKACLIKRLSASAKHEPPSLDDILKARSQLRKPNITQSK